MITRLSHDIYPEIFRYVLKFKKSQKFEFKSNGAATSRDIVFEKIRSYLHNNSDRDVPDSEICNWLVDSGINIARRTVNKYRHLLKK